MVLSNQLNPGMILSISGKLYRVESSVKVTVPKGTPFIKAKLRDLSNQEVVEKNFKLNQELKDIAMTERKIEFLYMEGKDYLFLDINSLDQVVVPSKVIGNKANYLKEGVDVNAACYGESIFAIELPQFLEIMVGKIDSAKNSAERGTRMATLETGAKVEVPLFIEVGDIIKVDTTTDEYVQRV